MLLTTDDFDFELPPHLIATHPLSVRSQSRLLHVTLPQGTHQDRLFMNLSEVLHPGDLLVFNNSKVIPARLFGHKSTGGRIEILVDRLLNNQEALVHIRASKAPKPGSVLCLEGGYNLSVKGRVDDLFHLYLPGELSWLNLLDKIGEMPLPPYMERTPEAEDKHRYQTVYALHPGSVAAPTAGLHFDETLLKNLKEKGIESAYVTLHVGAGTFQPVRVSSLSDHKMHSEWCTVPQTTVDKIKATKAQGGRVIAVGTTAVRSLESAVQNGSLEAYEGETNIFIYPGYSFQVIDSLITNFHLPKSTLLMLVSAFSSLETIQRAYQHAISQGYRFFSYGDAMFLDYAKEPK